jgi:hypothetical protein
VHCPCETGILKTGVQARLQFKLAALAKRSDAPNERGSGHSVEVLGKALESPPGARPTKDPLYY